MRNEVKYTDLYAPDGTITAVNGNFVGVHLGKPMQDAQCPEQNEDAHYIYRNFVSKLGRMTVDCKDDYSMNGVACGVSVLESPNETYGLQASDPSITVDGNNMIVKNAKVVGTNLII